MSDAYQWRRCIATMRGAGPIQPLPRPRSRSISLAVQTDSRRFANHHVRLSAADAALLQDCGCGGASTLFRARNMLSTQDYLFRPRQRRLPRASKLLLFHSRVI